MHLIAVAPLCLAVAASAVGVLHFASKWPGASIFFGHWLGDADAVTRAVPAIANWQAQRQEDAPARGDTARCSGKRQLAVAPPRLRQCVLPYA
jgi:hypothetical protein